MSGITKEETIDLLNIQNGAAVEKFQFEFDKVMKDILDPNTRPTATREVTLKFTFKPDEDRGMGTVLVSSSAKLAGLKPSVSKAAFGRGEDGRAIAREFMTQRDLFSGIDNVTSIETAREESDND